MKKGSRPGNTISSYEQAPHCWFEGCRRVEDHRNDTSHPSCGHQAGSGVLSQPSSAKKKQGECNQQEE